MRSCRPRQTTSLGVIGWMRRMLEASLRPGPLLCFQRAALSTAIDSELSRQRHRLAQTASGLAIRVPRSDPSGPDTLLTFPFGGDLVWVTFG